MDLVKDALRPPFVLRVLDEAGAEKEFKFLFPVPSLIEAEQALGRPLKTLADWIALKLSELPAIFLAGLRRSSPTITKEEVERIFDFLNAETLDEVHREFCRLNFPLAMAEFEAAIEAQRAAVANGEATEEDDSKNG